MAKTLKLNNVDSLTSNHPEQPFEWVVNYEDGTRYAEYEDDKEDGKFSLINKDKVFSLSLIGRNTKIGMLTESGVFFIPSIFGAVDFFSFALVNEDKSVTPLSNREGETYKNIIQYNGFKSDFNANLQAMGTVIDSYHIGWKKHIETKFGKFFFQVVLGLIMDSGIQFDFRISCDRKYTGTITTFKRNLTLPAANIEQLKPCKVDLNRGASQFFTVF